MPKPRRSLWILAAALAAVALVWAFLSTDRAPASPEPRPSMAGMPPAEEPRSPAPRSGPAPAQPPAPEAQPAASGVPDQPPTLGVNTDENPEIPPEAPQTP